jgi:transposase-like protein
MAGTMPGMSSLAKRIDRTVNAAEAERAAIGEMVKSGKERGLDITGPDGLLKLLTKTVLETALEEEMTEHLGYEKHDPAGRDGGNSRNGVRAKTVISEAAGDVTIEVPRDRAGSFTPTIVKKRQRRLDDVDKIVLSLYGKGMTTGEISAHFAEIYGVSVSKEVVSNITDKVLEEQQSWSSRPLASHYVAVFVDAIVRHEALCYRVEVEDLHRLVVAAAGLKLEAA